MSFFIRSKQSNKAQKGHKRKVEPKRKSKQDEITSSEDEDVPQKNRTQTELSDSDNETTQEKKVRLAKLYLEEIAKEERARLEKDELDQGVISKRLKEDYLKETGRLRVSVADTYKDYEISKIRTLKCKQQNSCITSVCSDDSFVYCGSDNGNLVKYSLATNLKVGHVPFVRNNSQLGHNSAVLSVAVSKQFLATGDKIGKVHIWDSNSLKYIKTLEGHKKSILGLSFKKESNTLYSCSKDKTLKVWNLDEMAYVETLFGHQTPITSVDSLYKDRAVSAGGRDLRVWKIPEETQMIYNGHLGSIDIVKLINEDHFLSGGDDGQICVWTFMRKKPLMVIENAHGIDINSEQPRWITALAALTNTDLFASGSYDGFVRLWKLDPAYKKHKEVLRFPVHGVVNALQFVNDGKELLVAVGREYRLGRWVTVKDAKNVILIVPFVII